MSLRIRAELFTQLQAMEKAGLPVDRALGLLQMPEQRRVTNARRLFAKGINLADAGASSGLFTRAETALIRAALRGGSPEPIYYRLAERYTRRASQVAQIKSKMLLPAFMLVSAFFIQPLPSLVAGSLSLTGYLAGGLIKVGVISGLWALARRLPGWLEQGESPAIRRRMDLVLAALPVVGPIYLRRNVVTFFENLALLVEAGMPILDALPEAEATVTSRRIQQQLSRIEPLLRQGLPLAQAVGQLAIPGRGPAQQFIRTGEESGALPEMLFRFADRETEAIEHNISIITQWLPRLVYAGVAGWIAIGVLQGGPPGSLDILRQNDL